MRETYQRDSDQIAELKRERDGMFQKAGEKLENEQPQPEKDAKRKLEETAVKKKVEELFPGRLAELNAKLKPLEDRQRLNAPKAEIVFAEGKQQQKAHVLVGGEVNRPGEEVEAGFIKAMIPTENLGPQRETHRTDLARWLTSADHPLTARVMVNRLWQHHFGVGIVATPSDFGRNGRPPTHPELLDWLALYFVKEGYSIKKMHRLMMTSAAYQRSSAFSAEASAQDPENTLLWRMNRRRLEGESIRDSILAVSGILDSTMAGPVFTRNFQKM